jgi:hypothetical protein
MSHCSGECSKLTHGLTSADIRMGDARGDAEIRRPEERSWWESKLKAGGASFDCS